MARKRRPRPKSRARDAAATPDRADLQHDASTGDTEPAAKDHARTDDSTDGRADVTTDGRRARRAAERAERKTERRAAPPHAEDVESPRFWFGFELAWAKLAISRFVIFALLAADAVLQLGHAPRYGAGGFNVAHLPLLDDLGAGRVGYAVGQLACAYLLTLVALGVATRLALPIAAAIYAWLYFGSQLDSYQHHYLVALFLVLACFVPWQRPADAAPRTPVRSWAVRLILVQLGIMYLWAAISKMDAAWVDGRTLQLQLTGGVRSLTERTIGFSGAAWLTLLAELTLAATIWSRRGWKLALPIGLGLHLGIAATGLDIGLFAYLMLGMYLLIVPDRVFVVVMNLAPVRALRELAPPRAFAAVAIALGGLVLGAGAAMMVRLPYTLELAIACSVVVAMLTVVGALRGRWSLVAAIGVAHLVAILLWLGLDRASSTTVDYYRFWGGAAKRLGDVTTAEHAYATLREVVPDEPTSYYQLGRIYLDRNDEVLGLAALRDAQRLEPDRARAWVAEAKYLWSRGRRDEAIAAARAAVAAQPEHRDARNLLGQYTTPLAPGPARPPAVEAAPPVDPDDRDGS